MTGFTAHLPWVTAGLELAGLALLAHVWRLQLRILRLLRVKHPPWPQRLVILGAQAERAAVWPPAAAAPPSDPLVH